LPARKSEKFLELLVTEEDLQSPTHLYSISYSVMSII
jgi:hypothetical protein